MNQEALVEIIIASGSLVVSGLVGLVSLKIKNSVSDIREEQNAVKTELMDYQRNTKEELVRNQTDLRLDLTVKHTENKVTFVAHAAEDARQFGMIENTLKEIRQKLEDIS